jgi:trigger factor
MSIKSTHTRKENAILEFSMEIQPEDIKEQYVKELERFRSKYKMPGFREGKVPSEIIEKNYKPEIETRTVERIISDAYTSMLTENKYVPYSEPKFEEFTINVEKPMKVSGTIELYPHCELGEYKDLPIVKDSIKVSDEDLEHQLEHLKEENASLVITERGIQEGDTVVMDLEGSLDGKVLDDMKLEASRVEVRKGNIPDDLIDGLRGMKKDEAGEIKVKYPADYSAKKLAGKTIIFKVKIQDVMEKKVPDLDDEFAKDLGAFADLAALKKAVMDDLEASARRTEDSMFENRLIEAIIDKSKFHIPQSYIEKHAERKLNELKQTLVSRGLSFETFLESEHTTADKVKEDLKKKVFQELKGNLAWVEVAAAEGIKVTDDDMNKLIADMAERYKKPVEEIRKFVNEEERKEHYAAEILYRKTLDFLKPVTKEKKGKVLKYSELHRH